jgi:hypothetical protein
MVVSNKIKYQGMIRELVDDGELIDYEVSEYDVEGEILGHHRWIIGFVNNKVIAILEADDADPFMNLENLYAVEKRKGYASIAMGLITHAANKWKVNMELDVAPFNYSLSTGMKNNHIIMDEESLELFYQRFGFVKNNLDGIEYFHRIVV